MITLYKPDCVSNYCELHARHGKLHAHAYSLRMFRMRFMKMQFAIERTSHSKPDIRCTVS